MGFLYTVVSEIFAGHNFCKFCEEGQIRENSFAKIIVGMYKMAAVHTLVVRATCREQRANVGIFKSEQSCSSFSEK